MVIIADGTSDQYFTKNKEEVRGKHLRDVYLLNFMLLELSH